MRMGLYLTTKCIWLCKGINYEDTFSSVAKMSIVRILLTFIIHNQCDVHQLDVSNAFLHGKIDKPVYMKQPVGFTNSSHHDYVCLLQKAIYGLKQPPKR